MAEFEAGPIDDFAEAKPVHIDADGTEIAVVRLGGRLYAVADRCSHAKASLSEGEVIADEASIECPRHGATFDLATGEALSLPATFAVDVYRVVERAGRVYVDIQAES